ncbi:MAG: dihydrodipicolinate synthase family protein, partial [Rhodocyclaceae bacterium]
MIRGSIPALVTPMQEDGSLDLPALRRLLDWHIEEGSDAVVVVGTTGESPTVDMEEHCLLIRESVAHVAGRIPVIAGTGANSTAEASDPSQEARSAGWLQASIRAACAFFGRPR